MYKSIFVLLMLLSFLFSQQMKPPSHLKYFGYAAIDCLWDDPHDRDTIKNYIREVDSFTNLAHLCVYDYLDDIQSRVLLMNNLNVKPLVSLSSVFFNFDGGKVVLHTDFSSRWDAFCAINSSVFSSARIGAFYIFDEPGIQNVSFRDINTVSETVKRAFPEIPNFMVEAYSCVDTLTIPNTIDWIGFDMYGVLPLTDSVYLATLEILKSKRKSDAQKIFLIVDDQWLPMYGDAGIPPDSMIWFIQSYYHLAVSDTDVIGLIGYLWPGGLDEPAQLGLRNLPETVITANIEIGKLIKANSADAVEKTTSTTGYLPVSAYPNPAAGGQGTVIRIPGVDNEMSVRFFDLHGREVLGLAKTAQKGLFKFKTESVANGLYLWRAFDRKNKSCFYGKFLIQR